MKKLIVLMMILALCVACFAGCGGKNDTSTTGGSESTGENTAEITGTDVSTGTTENDETLGAEDLETLPEEGDVNALIPEIDIDVDVEDGPVDSTEGTTEQENTQPTTAETTQPTQDDDTDEPTDPIQSTEKPSKDYSGDDEDDFVIDFDDLIGKG